MSLTNLLFIMWVESENTFPGLTQLHSCYQNSKRLNFSHSAKTFLFRVYVLMACYFSHTFSLLFIWHCFGRLCDSVMTTALFWDKTVSVDRCSWTLNCWALCSQSVALTSWMLSFICCNNVQQERSSDRSGKLLWVCFVYLVAGPGIKCTAAWQTQTCWDS